MKRLVVAFLLVGAFTVSSVAFASSQLAAAAPSGTYKTNVTSAALGGVLKGAWTVDFKGGTYTVKTRGTVVVKGKFAVAGSKITLTHETGTGACPATGTYTFKASGSSLTFTRIADKTCAARSVVLSGKFTKVG